MNALVIVEHDNQNYKSLSINAIIAALELSSTVDALVAGYNCKDVARKLNDLGYVNKIILADDPCYEHQSAESLSLLIATFAKDYKYIIAASTTFGKNLSPRIAGKLKLNMVSDVIKIVSAHIFLRPIYAGNAIATVQNDEEIKILSIRPTAFTTLPEKKIASTIVELDKKSFVQSSLSHFIKQSLTESSRPDLSSAKIVIAGGRGLKSAENFKLLEEIADLLGAAVGASRAAVDAGFAPNDYQVGQTGKVIAPDLYIAVGISGAIQHLAGMKESKVIVAINNDPEAPIFELADYGLVGDLFSILAEFKEQIMQLKQ